MIERDKLKSRAVKTNDAETWDKFKNFKNCVNNKIKNAKNAYCQQNFESNAGNSQIIWQTINEVMARNLKANRNVPCVKDNSNTNDDPVEISEALNKHFAEIGPNLASKLLNPTNSFASYIKPAKTSFFLANSDSQQSPENTNVIVN